MDGWSGNFRDSHRHGLTMALNPQTKMTTPDACLTETFTVIYDGTTVRSRFA